jgi:hypothetical protein
MYLRQTAQHEELDRQKIELHRKQHAERLARIMDERHRTIGLELDVLEKQVEERKAREAAEKADELDYQRRFLEEQRLLGRLAREEQKIRRQIIEDDLKFHRDCQSREQSREWDITRPDYLQVQPPVRATDNDPWLSVSGGQKFDGEDLGSDDRARRQGDQRNRWMAQQTAENEHKRACELRDQREWERRYLENDRTMEQIEADQKAARKEIQSRNDEENLRSWNERKKREKQDRDDELEFNEFEKLTTNESPFMTESRDQAVGRGGRRIVQDWKGMTDADRKDIRSEQGDQRAENAAWRHDQAEREKLEDALRAKETRDAIKRERAEARARQQTRVELADQYRRGADQHKDDEEYRNKHLYYENLPGDDFWQYFGKSHR